MYVDLVIKIGLLKLIVFIVKMQSTTTTYPVVGNFLIWFHWFGRDEQTKLFLLLNL